ncbi:Uncharacterized protein TCM_009852 [Theobroma cacao]|uniref:Uncharacterized protein n=1 Tax=Theobroma cacao TaxID=3641 RepID=A0A061E771_THECC|nr:Uncharacterized protein TCM_009852 [Theobroma cacao]
MCWKMGLKTSGLVLKKFGEEKIKKRKEMRRNKENHMKKIDFHELHMKMALEASRRRRKYLAGGDKNSFGLIKMRVKASFGSFDQALCSHSSDQCPSNFESVKFVGNFNKQQTNPYSNTYNPGWRNHRNFSWDNNKLGPSNPRLNNPPSFPPQPKPLVLEKKPTMEQMFMQFMTKIDAYMTKNDAIIQNQAASIRNLKIQTEQLVSSINNRP